MSKKFRCGVRICITMSACLFLLSASAGAFPFFSDESSDTPPLVVFDGHTDAVHSLAFIGSSGHIVSASRDKTVKIWDIKSGKALHTFTHESAMFAVAASPDGKKIAAGGTDHVVRVYDAETFELEAQLEGHTGPIWGVAFLPKGELLSGAGDGVRLWDIAAEKLLWKSPGRSDKSTVGMEFSRDGLLAITLDGYEGSVSVIDATRRTRTFLPNNRQFLAACIGITPDAKEIYFSDGTPSQLCRVDVKSEKKLTPLKAWSANINEPSVLAFSADGTRGFAARINSVGMWDMKTHRLLQVMAPAVKQGITHSFYINSLAVSPDGKQLAVGAGGADSIEGWKPSGDNFVAVYTLDDNARQPKMGPPEGSLSWDVIQTTIKTLAGEELVYEDWYDLMWTANLEHPSPSPCVRRLHEGLDAVVTPFAVALNRGGSVLQEILSDRKEAYSDAVWDGRNIWVGSLVSGPIILDPMGKVVERLPELPITGELLKLYPVAPGKVLAVSAKYLGEAWCAMIERVPGGKPKVDIFYKSSQLPESWPGMQSSRTSPPARTFLPLWIQEPPRAAGTPRVVWIGCGAAGMERRVLSVDVDRLTVEIGNFPTTATNGMPLSHLDSLTAPVWFSGDQCLIGGSTIYRAKRRGAAGFDSIASVVLMPDWAASDTQPLLNCNGAAVLPGERWYKIDLKTLQPTYAGPAIYDDLGGREFFVSGVYGPAIFSAGKFYVVSTDPDRPRLVHAARILPVRRGMVIDQGVSEAGSQVCFRGGDVILRFDKQSGRLQPMNPWNELPPPATGEMNECLAFMRRRAALRDLPEERQRIGLSNEQLKRLAGIPEQPVFHRMPPTPTETAELERLFKEYRAAASGADAEHAKAALLSEAKSDSDQWAKSRAEFLGAARQIFTARQLDLLAYKPTPSK